MEHHEDGYPPIDQLAPTYKSLFVGACIVIGSAFGWWLTNFIASVNVTHASIERRLVELEAGSREANTKLQRLQEDVKTDSDILRELDRDVAHRKR